jgi:uncharacterized oligopeptide transporter (OPT) family protein
MNQSLPYPEGTACASVLMAANAVAISPKQRIRDWE